MDLRGKAIFAQAEDDDVLSARSFAGLFRASRALNERLSVYGQYDFLRDLFAGVEQRHVVEGGVSYLAVDRKPHRLRQDAGLGYLHEEHPDDDLDSATLSLGAGYRLEISPTSEFTYEPRYLLPFADTGDWRSRDQPPELLALLQKTAQQCRWLRVVVAHQAATCASFFSA